MFLYCLLCGREKGEGCFVHLCENIFMEGTVLLSPAVLHRTVLLQVMFKGHTVQATRTCISSLFCRISAAAGLFFVLWLLCFVFFFFLMKTKNKDFTKRRYMYLIWVQYFLPAEITVKSWSKQRPAERGNRAGRPAAFVNALITSSNLWQRRND